MRANRPRGTKERLRRVDAILKRIQRPTVRRSKVDALLEAILGDYVDYEGYHPDVPKLRALLRAAVREHAAMRRLWEGGLSPGVPEERIMREMDKAVAALVGGRK
jgi:hypothetical protein